MATFDSIKSKNMYEGMNYWQSWFHFNFYILWYKATKENLINEVAYFINQNIDVNQHYQDGATCLIEGKIKF